MNDHSEDQQSTVSQPSRRDPFQDFDRLVEGFKKSLNKFQKNQSPENFAGIISALSEFGISGADVWRQFANYSKRHPVRAAMFAGLVFFALKGLAPITPLGNRQETVH